MKIASRLSLLLVLCLLLSPPDGTRPAADTTVVNPPAVRGRGRCRALTFVPDGI
jgi:hypothetical protein